MERSAKPAKPATPGYLERVALRYLERYAGSVERVRRVLARRVTRSVAELGTDPEEGLRAIDEVLAKLRRLGYLDDARFAGSRTRTLRKRGKSARAVRAALSAQGIAAATIDAALAGEDVEVELDAARAFVKRRRLGPHRASAEAREAEREKDLARLGRAGFSYAIALRALSSSSEDDGSSTGD